MKNNKVILGKAKGLPSGFSPVRWLGGGATVQQGITLMIKSRDSGSGFRIGNSRVCWCGKEHLVLIFRCGENDRLAPDIPRTGLLHSCGHGRALIGEVLEGHKRNTE
jgi:hypothetical protein